MAGVGDAAHRNLSRAGCDPEWWKDIVVIPEIPWQKRRSPIPETRLALPHRPRVAHQPETATMTGW